MFRESPWVDVPALLDESEFARAKAAFIQEGVEFWSDAVMTSAGSHGGSHSYALQVNANHARKAAKILRGLLELEDPAQDTPFTGNCPACEEPAIDAWSCPSCELSFRSPGEPDDLMIVFLREHGGFREL